MRRWMPVLVLLMALPAAGADVPMPPERPAAEDGSGAGPIPAARPATAEEAGPAAATPAPPAPVPAGALVAPDPLAAQDGTSPPLPPVKPAASGIRTAVAARTAPASRPDIPPASPPAGAGSGGQLVCGDPRLVGRIKPTVTGRYPGCLITDPVEVTAIAGIRLSMPATLACPTARRFADWITGVADPAARKMLAGRISRVWVMGSFACRTRNSLRGTRLSQHSVGRAVDVGGFTLGDGRKVRVSSDWGKGAAGTFLRHIWKRSCGMFKTVLGPDGDRFHQDHLHLDLALRRSTYCR